MTGIIDCGEELLKANFKVKNTANTKTNQAKNLIAVFEMKTLSMHVKQQQ